MNEKELAEQIGFLVMRLWTMAKDLEAAKAALAAKQDKGSAAPQG